MSATEAERHELYELAKRGVGDRFAELMIKSLPPEPERLATKDDVALLGADLRTEMADLRTDLKTEMADLRTELRTEMADLRTEMATTRAELVDRIDTATTRSTRTLVVSMMGSVTLMAVANVLTIAVTR